MPILSLRLTDEQQQQLEGFAREQNKTVSDYIKAQFFPSLSQPSEHTLTHKMILEKVSNYQKGRQFSIPELFEPEEWASFDNTISVGRTFRIAQKNTNTIVAQTVKFVEKKSGQAAVYEII